MFKLKPNPTFKANVSIPSTDGAGVIEFEFKHKTRKEVKTYFESLGEGDAAKSDTEALSDLIVGWGKSVDCEYNAENLETLLDNYPAAAKVIFEAYNKALFEGQQKNS